MNKKPYGAYQPGMSCISPDEHARLMDEEASPKRQQEMEDFERFLDNFKFPVKPITVKLTMTRDGKLR